MQFNEHEHLTENMVATADDIAECGEIVELTELEIEDRQYTALQNRRTIETLLAKRGIVVTLVDMADRPNVGNGAVS